MTAFATAAADTWGLWAVIALFTIVGLLLLAANRHKPQDHPHVSLTPHNRFMHPWERDAREPGTMPRADLSRLDEMDGVGGR